MAIQFRWRRGFSSEGSVAPWCVVQMVSAALAERGRFDGIFRSTAEPADTTRTRSGHSRHRPRWSGIVAG